VKKARAAVIPLLFFILLFAAVPASQNSACAEDNGDETEKSLDDISDEILDGLDFDGYDEFLNSLQELNDTDIKTLVKKILDNDDTFDFNYFIEFCLNLLAGNIGGLLAQVLIIVAATAMLSVLQNATSAFAKSSTRKIVFLASYGLIITVVGVMAASAISESRETLSVAEKFTDAVFPVLLTLMTAIGATTTAAIYQPLVLAFSSTVLKITDYVVMPLFYVSFVFAVIGNISDDIKLEKISSFAKSAGDWIIGIVFGLFVTITTSKGITGASMDSLAIRGAKYALSSYVPVVGGYLKDGFDIVVAGCIVIKNALGAVSIAVLLIATLAPVIKIVCTIFALKLAAALTEPFGDKKISSMLCGVGKALSMLVVASVCTVFVLIVVITLILASCNMGLV
jgi:stage III sporulation protein AE